MNLNIALNNKNVFNDPLSIMRTVKSLSGAILGLCKAIDPALITP